MASGFTTLTNEHLIRTNLWSRQIKELLLDDLFAMRFVRILQDFPDGTTFNIRSITEGYENFAICWKPLKLFLLLSENERGKNSIERGQSAGKKFNERNRLSLVGWDMGWRRLNPFILEYRAGWYKED